MPFFQSNLTQASNYANQPYQPYTGQRVAGVEMMNPYTSDRYANQQVRQVTRDIKHQYKQGVQPALMAQFQQGGAFGGTAHEQALAGAQGAFAHQLAEAASGIRSQNAQAQRAEWDKMLGRDQQYLDTGYQQYLDQRDFPAQRIGLMNQALASIKGGVSNQQQTGANPNYTSAAQNAATYASIIASMYG